MGKGQPFSMRLEADATQSVRKEHPGVRRAAARREPLPVEVLAQSPGPRRFSQKARRDRDG